MQGLLDDKFNERKRNITKGFKQDDDDLEKGHGEGSKGGHVIGHTKSGKPIYSNKGASDYKDYSAQDHADAADVHNKKMYAHLDKFLNSTRGGGGNKIDLDKKQHHQNMSLDHYSMVNKQQNQSSKDNTDDDSKVVYTADHEKKPIKKGAVDDLSKGGVGSGPKMAHSQWKQNNFHDSENGYDNYLDAVHGHFKTKAGNEPEMEKHIEQHIDGGYANQTHPKHIAEQIDAHYNAHYKTKK